MVEAINGFGYRWYTKVPKVGEKAAAQILQWLSEPGVSAMLGIALHARGVTPKTNLAAIEAWLSKCKPGKHTRRSYRKEAERFVLWSIVDKGNAVSLLTVEDCIDYRYWLWNYGRPTKKASTHWLRHTFATHFLQTGGELAILRDLLGHKSLSTTSVYVTTERDSRSRAMEAFGRNTML